MLHKVEYLESIGKFINYSAAGDVAFRKLTAVYADNGSGKTTLTSILRSLSNGDNSIIERRLSTGSTSTQRAQITQRKAGSPSTHTFRTAGWSSLCSDIEIFDSHFVSENIFSGFHFTDDHKKQLYQFVIGAQGVAIQQQIEQNKTDKTNSRQIINTSLAQLYQRVGNGLAESSVSGFLQLTVEPADIDIQISNAEASLTSANRNSIIQSTPLFSQLANISSPISIADLLSDIATVIGGLREEALDKVFEEHCTDLKAHTIVAPEEWLKKGFDYLDTKEKKEQPLECPFCKQSITTLEIINAYTQQFNEAFNRLLNQLANHSKIANSFNVEAVIQGLNSAISANAALETTWKGMLPAFPSLTISVDLSNLKVRLAGVQARISEKQHNPTKAIPDTEIREFEKELQDINEQIRKYNFELQQLNITITTFRAGIKSIAQAQLELDEVKRVKQRFVPAIAAICTQLLTERQNLATLEAAYPNLVHQQQTTATSFFGNYKTRINHYLNTVFKTPFSIDNVSHVAPAGRATVSKIGYGLRINGQAISFDHADNHNIKDCLSEGDKSTLALAFFLSKLDLDPQKADKIVVFDDPLSSFDRNRRLYTLQLFQDLLPHVEQIIVLSHNELFLFDLIKRFAPADKKELHIQANVYPASATIVNLSLDSLFEPDYFKHIKALEDYLAAADISKKDIILGSLRLVLEANLKFKYHRPLAILQPSQRTFGNIISTLETAGTTFRDTNTAVVLTDLRTINGVSCKPHHGEPVQDYGTLGVHPDTMTVTELTSFVQQTLDLVDHRL